MIVDDQVRELVLAIEADLEIDCSAKIVELINILHSNCQKSAVKQRYKDYAVKKFSIGIYPIDTEGYAISFDPLTQEKEIWDCWNKFGVVVSKQVISPELAQTAIARMGEIVKQVSNGTFDIEDPTTYSSMPIDKDNVPFMSRGFVEIYHDDILAQLRQSLLVYLHYVIIWGRVDLWTTFDRMGIKLPGHDESAALPLHVDQNPLVDQHHHTRVQGVLALVDCKKRGTLVVVPGSQILFPEYGQQVVKNNSNYRGAYVELDLTQTFASTLAKGKQVIPIRAGCLVSWSSGVTHANTKNIASDARKVAYIAMCPANEFDQQSLEARDSAFTFGVSRYDHKAGLHVTKKPRYTASNTFRRPERLTFLGDLLYSRRPYFAALNAKSDKRLLLNAELFGFGPSSIIADLFPKLCEHFSYIGFIGSKFSYELQPSGYDAVYIIDDNNYDENYIQNVMSHYDILFTCSDFKMAEIARSNNLPVVVYDQLAWFWPTIPQILSKPDVLYLAQDFFTVRDRIEHNRSSFSLANVIPPIIGHKDRVQPSERPNILLNLGGLKNPFWSNDNMLDFARLIYESVRSSLPMACNLIVAANSFIAEKLNGKYYTRDQMHDLLSTVSISIITPGLGNIFECAAYNIPTIFLPPANDSQARQAQLIAANASADSIIDWQDLGLSIDYTASQSNIMLAIATAVRRVSTEPELRFKLNEQIKRAYEIIKPLTSSRLGTLLDKFGANGSNQVVQAVKSFAEAHRPWLANRARPAIVFNLPDGQQLRLESNMLQLTADNIRQIQAHIPGLTIADVSKDNPTVRLTHVQATDSNEKLILASVRDIQLQAKYATKMPQDLPHLLYGITRRVWLEQQQCPVHAACLEMPDGRFILIVGNTGTGKSSSALKLVLAGHAKLYSGDKTLIKFVDNHMYAIAGTRIMTLRQHDRNRWAQIDDAQGDFVADRFVFELLPHQYSSAEAGRISAIFVLQPHAPMSLLSGESARHTLFPYFLDMARANVIVGNTLFDGNISYAAMNGIRGAMAVSVPQLPVYQLSIAAGDVLENIKQALNISEKLEHYGKKKFLFGVCGLGYGHTYRQLPIIDALIAEGHEVAIFAYGMALEKFNAYYAHNPAVKIFQVANEFILGNKDGLDYAASAVSSQNSQDFTHINLRALSLYNDIPDCVISDYEKISAQVAFRYNVPLVTIDQQSKFMLIGNPPDEIQRIRTFFPTATKRVALSFFNVTPIEYCDAKVILMPPVLRPEILELKGKQQFSIITILVYNSAMYPLNIERLQALFVNFADVRFIFFPNHTDNYLDILGGCHGIISTAGHSLLSEAMYLQKPVLAIPSPIFEQQLNAKTISENGFGMECSEVELSISIIQEFLQRLNEFKQKIQVDPKKVLMGGIDNRPILDLLYSCLQDQHKNKNTKKCKLY